VIYRFRADRPTIVVGLSLLCLVVPILFVIGDLLLMRQAYVGEIDKITPRAARLLGLIESEESLTQSASGMAEVLATSAYSSDVDSATTAASMQQMVREVMTSAGLSVSGSQILPGENTEGFENLNLDITVVGNINAVEEALSNLRMIRPLVLVESVTIKKLRATRTRAAQKAKPKKTDERMLSVRLRLLSMRLVG
jgi:general secretion pathway protein M